MFGFVLGFAVVLVAGSAQPLQVGGVQFCLAVIPQKTLKANSLLSFAHAADDVGGMQQTAEILRCNLLPIHLKQQPSTVDYALLC